MKGILSGAHRGWGSDRIYYFSQYSQPARPPTGAPEAWPVGYGLCGPETAWGGPGHQAGWPE